MDIEPKQLAEKPKKVGKSEGRDIYQLRTKGGWHMIVAPKNGRMETLGAGPLAAVARHIANKKKSDIEWTELSKSEHVSPEAIEELVPKYEKVTHEIRVAAGDETE
jgi:hypothetical protein